MQGSLSLVAVSGITPQQSTGIPLSFYKLFKSMTTHIISSIAHHGALKHGRCFQEKSFNRGRFRERN